MWKSSLRVLIYFCLLLLLWISSATGATLVKVGIDSFPPYAIKNQDGSFSGLNIEMLALLNRFQSKYRFVPVITSATRRFEHFSQKLFDMSLSDQIIWGWQGYEVEASRTYLHGGEKYVALAKPGRGQEYFDDFKEKQLCGVLGYHYGLADHIYDPKLLKEKYNMQLSTTHAGNLLKVINQRVDIAIVTQAYIHYWLRLNPGYKELLLISDKWDQQYELKMVIRKGISPNVRELDHLLTQMTTSGLLAPLWKKYGVDVAD